MDMNSINSWLQASVRLAAPLMLVSVGGVYTERVGIINIGMEGMMLAGALASVAASFLSGGNIFVAAIFAMVVGGLLGLVHAYLTVSRRASQLVSGLAINLLAVGGTAFGYARLFPIERTRVALFPVLIPPEWHDVPFFGPVIFAQPVIVWAAFILPLVSAWVLYRTSWGLNIRAVGEHPHAVATAGLSVYRLKYAGVILSGVFAGLGGSALAIAELGYFAPIMTAGRAFVVLAALVVGKWNPIVVAAVCLLFGAADALQLRIQALGSVIPYQFPVMAPYLLTVAALAGLVGRTVAPKTLGVPYDPESY
jgi:simple sugar transport system permease protein